MQSGIEGEKVEIKRKLLLTTGLLQDIYIKKQMLFFLLKLSFLSQLYLFLIIKGEKNSIVLSNQEAQKTIKY